jgi:hypothetical protein
MASCSLQTHTMMVSPFASTWFHPRVKVRKKNQAVDGQSLNVFFENLKNHHGNTIYQKNKNKN